MFPEFTPMNVSQGRLWYQLNSKTEQVQFSLLSLFCIAIAEFEGFYKENSISQQNNNPGNLRPIGGSGFRTFDDPLDGWEALKDQVLRNIDRGLTLREFFLGKEGVYPGYAPLADNDPKVMENYISFVANRCSFAKNIDLRYYFPIIATTGTPPADEYGFLWGYKPFGGF